MEEDKENPKISLNSVAVLFLLSILAIEFLHGGPVSILGFCSRVFFDIIAVLLIYIALSNWLK